MVGTNLVNRTPLHMRWELLATTANRLSPLSMILVLLVMTACSSETERSAPRRGETSAVASPAPQGVIDTALQPPPSTGNRGHGFGGDWTWSNDREGLTLTLAQEGSRLSGHHEAWEQYGDRVDVVGDDEVSSINGRIDGNVARVDFRSGVAGVSGKGLLTLVGEELQWEIVSIGDGECYIPKKARLHRAPADDEDRPQLDEGAEAQREERASRAPPAVREEVKSGAGEEKKGN